MRRTVLVTGLLLMIASSEAQYFYSYLKTKDGLSNHRVNALHKDADGFVWMGTNNGLNRYDGSGFRVFNHSKKTLPPEISEVIRSVTSCGNDTLWIANSGGIASYAKSTGRFNPVIFKGRGGEVFKELSGYVVLKDHFNRIWAFTSAGVFTIRNMMPEPVTVLNTALEKINYKPLYSGTICADSVQNGIWIGTTDGLYFYNYKTNDVESWRNNPRKLAVFRQSGVSSITKDRKDGIWFSDLRIRITHYKFSDNSMQVWDKAEEIAGLNMNCRSLFTDSRERLWISSWQGRSFVIHPDGRVDISPKEPKPNGQLAGLFVNEIFEDEYGTIWNATNDGVAKLQIEPLIQKQIQVSTDGYAINMVRRGGNSLVIAKENGLFFYEESSGVVQHFTVSPGGGKPNRFFEMAAVNGEWWCGTGNGIQIFNPRTKKFRQLTGYPFADAINKISVTHLVKDRRGNIWFAAWGDAVYRYDPVTRECIRFDGTKPEHGDIKALNSLAIKEDKEGRIWVGMGEQGVRVFSYEKNRFHKITRDKEIDLSTITAISEDSRQQIWLSSSGNGIFKLNRDGQLLEHFTSANKLESNFTFGLTADKKDRLWYGSGNHLYYLNPATGTPAAFNYETEIPLDDIWPCMWFENDRGYFAINDRILQVDEKLLDRQPKIPVPLITSVSVFEKQVFYSQEKPELDLQYRDNFFTIEFSSPLHNEFSTLQYAYKLEGVNNDWVYCGRRQVASFTHVPNGRYHFMVKSTDTNGVWSDQVKTVVIRIRPPFWKTGWFISLMALVAAVLAWVFYRSQKKKTRKKQIERTIDYFANSVYGENSVNEICWDIARNCISQLQFEDCVVYLLDERKNRLVQKAAYGPKNPKGHEIENPIEIEAGKGIVGTAAQTGKPLLIGDTSKDERYIIDDEARLSELAVPILHNGKVIGVIDSEHSQKNFFTEDHLKALTTIASISANKIAEAQAESIAKENEIKLLEINKLLAESQLMALRAQMNPHFVFNCLNSIQECIVTQKYGEASDYLNKFSKLFRLVLNNSGRNLVTIEEEAEVLRLYLELERMRFENSFNYSIRIDEAMEGEELLIPSMLVQPYVENALWHGLMHKEGERNLLISFEKISDETYRCVIDDNGIGRKRSFELKEQQSKAKRHESKGLKISKDRLDVLQRQGYHATQQIIDKQDEEGNASGTRIIIELSTDLTT